MHKAYSTLEIKAVDAEQRIIEGVASTPSVDRGGDVMVPAGAQFSLPIPFLWLHRDPVGEVFSADVRKDGIHIKAKFSKLADTAPASLKERIEEAWHSVSAKPPLVRGLSIGWKGLEGEPIKDTPYWRWFKWIWGELSAVVIPMNVDATITNIKSFDQAASGPHPPGDTGTSTVVRLQKAAPPMTIAEQISGLEAKRAANFARMTAIQTKATDAGVTKDAAEKEEFTTLKIEIKSIDDELTDLRDMERMSIKAATPIIAAMTQEKASEMRGGNLPIITVKPMLPKGTAFTRMVQCLVVGKGDSYQAMERAKSYKDMPEVELLVKAAVAAGVTTDATWAGPLVPTQVLVDEFLELLRPRTLLGRIPGLRKVPFNVSIPSQTTGGTYGWVGQNKPKPVTKADYASVSVPFAKAAGIIVISEELAKLSSPSAEALIREEMIAGMGAFLDTQFVDPAVAVAANVSPASITNGAATIASSGVTGAAAKLDLASRVAVFAAANIPLEGSVWLMNEANAFGLGLSVNALGQPLFPGLTIAGGTILGIPAVVSNNVGARVILVHAGSILYADEGGVRIDVSREASIQMDSAPTDAVDATTVYISLWQRNLIALRAERMVTWIRARAAAVTYITTASPYIGT